MKKHEETVGVDVSKLTIDVFIQNVHAYEQFSNNESGFKAMLAWAKKKGVKTNEVLFCFEHTGIYSIELASFLSKKKISFAMLAAIEIKRAMGMVRGKNDKVDAMRIAEYAHLRKGRIKETVLPSEKILKMKYLFSLRERMVSDKAGYEASKNEFRSVFKSPEFRKLLTTQAEIIDILEKQIQDIEEELMTIIKSDELIYKQYKLITSAIGIGFVTATYLLITTNCFTAFDDPRKYACYAGIAPFGKQSGTSINGRNKVSHLANKRMKALLYTAASSALQHDPQIKKYYTNRLKQGKNRMSTINIIKNKLIYRVFAIIKRGTPYVPLEKHLA